MSVIVKGMEMPDTCGDCSLYSYIGNVCKHDGTEASWDYKRLPRCPLVELPENHGKLIDGTELAKILETAIMNMKTMAQVLDAENNPEINMEIKAYCDILNGVKDMEAVIEAEGNDG